MEPRLPLFVPGEFRAHSGALLPFKIDCDAFSDEEIGLFADLILKVHPGPFSCVMGVPSGGLRLMEAIRARVRCFDDLEPALIVDDVLTTGASIEYARDVCHMGGIGVVYGAVIFARGPCPPWVTPIFSLHTELWT